MNKRIVLFGVVVGGLVGPSVARGESCESTGMSCRELARKHELIFRWEAQAVQERFAIDAGAGQPESTAVVPVGGPAEARGGGLRVMVGAHGWYGGFDVAIMQLTVAPQFVPIAMGTGREANALGIDGAGSFVGSGRAIAGYEMNVGPFLIGAELAAGMRSATLGGPDDRVSPYFDQTSMVVDARARVGMYLNRYVTLSVLGGAGMLDSRDRTFSFAIGLDPYGGNAPY